MELIKKYFPHLTERQLQQFAALDDLYKFWNSKVNVISRKDIEGLYLKHVLHSLSIAATIKFEAGTKIIDVGTGGGFPAIPLAIFFPEVHFHLVDSIIKKIKVAEIISTDIGLTNISLQQKRAEQIKSMQFDFAVSRAVTTLKELWSWVSPLLSTDHKNEMPNGLICLKGGDLINEIDESGQSAKLISIYDIFPEEFFKEKYLVHVAK